MNAGQEAKIELTIEREETLEGILGLVAHWQKRRDRNAPVVIHGPLLDKLERLLDQ